MVPIKSREELEARIEYLEEINRFTIDALEMAASLGDFQVSINKLQEPQAILRETGARVKRLIPFQTVGFYLIDENNANFSLSLVEPDEQRSLLQKDVDFLVENGTFAWALREKRGVSVSSKDFKRHLFLYVMATYSRIRGLFVGFLRPGEKNIPEVSLSLLSIILLNSANALESFELYRMVQKGRDELEIRVKERTLELAETNVKLQQEIIERKRTEKALRESEERYRNLVELSPDAVFIHVDGKYVFGNNAGTKLLGAAKPEDFIGKSIQEIVHPDHWPISQERIREIQKKGREIPRIEEKYIRLDGTAVDVEIASAPLVYEGEPAVQVVVRDITERKQAEGALRKSEENYRRLVENAPLGILTINPGGKIVDFNPVLARTLGFSSTDAICQMNVFDFSPLLESGIANDFLRCLASGAGGTFENAYRTQWGTEIFLRYHLTPIRENGHPVVGVQAILEDISETRKLQTQLYQAQKMEAIGTLAGGVAHDLNNILAGLVSYPDLLLLDLPDESPMRTIVTTIKNSGQRAAAIVQDLLTLARRGVAVREVLDLNAVVRDYFQTPEHEKLKDLHGQIQFTTELEEGPLKFLGSPVHLCKVVMNLISNAAEAMPKTGKISVRTSSRYVEKTQRGYEEIKEGEYVVLTVEDEGIGIPPKDINRIFEPFYTKKVMGRSGTGLGLAVVWGTAKDHKGYIDVFSREGKGSRFDLYLPVTRQEVNRKESPVAPEEMMGPEKVLITDDVQEQREVASLMLAKLGYDVKAVSSGEEAVAYLHDHPVDLVLLDMIMDPGMDGLETYKRILEINPRQKAILVSGYSETNRVKEALRLGAGGYVKKPFVMEKIGRVVRKELDRPQPAILGRNTGMEPLAKAG